MISSPADRRARAPAAARNREPIRAVLERVLPKGAFVLEVASGTGEHAAWCAPRLPGVVWQPSDVSAAALESVAAWVAAIDAPNLRPPVRLDVAAEVWPVAAADAVVAVNLIHISPWETGLALLRGAARTLRPGGVLYLYGPFREGGVHNAPSNEAFDADLRARDPAWGVRDLDDVRAAAARVGLVFVEQVAMPANNRSVIFRRAA